MASVQTALEILVALAKRYAFGEVAALTDPANRVLRVAQENPTGWRSYLDRQHSNTAHALAVCAVECERPCSVITRLSTKDERRVADGCRLALAYVDSPVVRLRHSAPVGHGFGVPSPQEVSARHAARRYRGCGGDGPHRVIARYAGGVVDVQKRERTWPRSFADRLTSPLPRARDVYRMMREGPSRKQLLVDAPRIPVSRADSLPTVATDRVAVTWVGHATFVVQIGGQVVVTDPVWSPGIPGVPRRLTPPGLPFEALPAVDAVVISHNHYDHLDAPTIRRFPCDTLMLVPAGLGRWFRRRGFRRIIELDWYESHHVGGIDFGFVPAHHWSRRTLTDTCRSLWGGWVLTTGEGQRVYFAGDTGYGHFFADIAARYPGIDLALMPVGAYEPNWFMKPVHLNPAEAVRACGDVGSPRMATMHWGTFILSAEPLLAPVQEAAKAWADAGLPREHLWDLAVGETRVL